MTLRRPARFLLDKVRRRATFAHLLARQRLGRFRHLGVALCALDICKRNRAGEFKALNDNVAARFV